MRKWLRYQAEINVKRCKLDQVIAKQVFHQDTPPQGSEAAKQERKKEPIKYNYKSLI